MRICVQGLWHLGSVISAGLASLGHEVVGLDFEVGNVESLSRGVPPVFEPGLGDLVALGLEAGRLRYSASAETATANAEVLWVACDTPIDESDNADPEFVIAQVERVLPHLSPGTVVLISSQLPVGSTARLEALAGAKFPQLALSFGCSPENLRIGQAVELFLNPDRIVVGARTARAREVLDRLLRSICSRIEWMSVESAEMTKHAINAFLATSATLANEIASICEIVGADAKQVERGLRTEPRIGSRAYVAPGAALAGGTLARDIRYLNRLDSGGRFVTPLLASIEASNNEHKEWTRRKLRRFFPDLSQIVVAVWGLTYKPGTDTLRRSGAVELCDWLIQQRATVRVHDPAVKALPEHWSDKVRRCADPLAAVEQAHALVIGTPWPLYREIAASRVLERAQSLTVLDATGFVPDYGERRGVRYVAVGAPDTRR
jgi:UDPglucose 6-dehydrogenase